MVGIAQLVESRIVIPVVVGSSPISHPRFRSPADENLQGFIISRPFTLLQPQCESDKVIKTSSYLNHF